MTTFELVLPPNPTCGKVLEVCADIFLLCQKSLPLVFQNITEERFNRKAAPQSWSAGECLEHLILANELYLRALEDKIAGKSRLTAPPAHLDKPYQSGFLGRMLVKSVSPLATKKVKAPGSFDVGQKSAVKLSRIQDYEKTLTGFLDCIRQSQELDLTKITVVSPASTLFRPRLGDVYIINAYHQERHLNQALRALAA